MKLFASVAVIALVVTAGAVHPSAAVPEVGAELAQWEDFARTSWSTRVVCRVNLRDGSIVDLEETYCDAGKSKVRNWEVTRDWRRGVSKLAFLKSQFPHDGIGLLLVNEPRIDNAEILRCAAACREFDICFKVVDEWGCFR